MCRCPLPGRSVMKQWLRPPTRPSRPFLRGQACTALAARGCCPQPTWPPSAAKTPSGGFLNKLFGGGRPRAGNKVAVYDISAAKVYMPDGSVLEAHSGIGKMADNPRYVHVKMNGPTPPQTYDLKMRESRFHGVEAVRMTPVGNQTMHGRDGMLTHSYLLRGRPVSRTVVSPSRNITSSFRRSKRAM
jgi:hypothetical protein